GGICNHLQFVQNELGDDESAVEKAGVGDVGDAAVDDDAGVQNHLILAGVGFGSEETAERGEVEKLSLGSSGDRADIGEEEHANDFDEVKRVRRFGTGMAD